MKKQYCELKKKNCTERLVATIPDNIRIKALLSCRKWVDEIMQIETTSYIKFLEKYGLVFKTAKEFIEFCSQGILFNECLLCRKNLEEFLLTVESNEEITETTILL